MKVTKECIPDGLIKGFGIIFACKIIEDIIKRKLTKDEFNMIQNEYKKEFKEGALK